MQTFVVYAPQGRIEVSGKVEAIHILVHGILKATSQTTYIGDVVAMIAAKDGHAWRTGRNFGILIRKIDQSEYEVNRHGRPTTYFYFITAADAEIFEAEAQEAELVEP